MSTDDQWLRATLTEPAVTPPADLADRAERIARGIRRRRVAATAVAVAALVAVPLAVQGTRTPDRTAGPVATPRPRVSTGECAGDNPVEPAPVAARTAADAAWPYRGDPRLEEGARAVGAGLADVRPLFGWERGAGVTVTVAAGRGADGWRLRYSGDDRRTTVHDLPLPVLGARTVLTLWLRGDWYTTVVVLAPPGATGIAQSYCRDPSTHQGGGYGRRDFDLFDLSPGTPAGVVSVRLVSGPIVRVETPATR